MKNQKLNKEPCLKQLESICHKSVNNVSLQDDNLISRVPQNLQGVTDVALKIKQMESEGDCSSLLKYEIENEAPSGRMMQFWKKIKAKITNKADVQTTDYTEITEIVAEISQYLLILLKTDCKSSRRETILLLNEAILRIENSNFHLNQTKNE